MEPSVGAGALFFALLEKFIRIGVSPSVLSEIRVDLVDINKHALSFVKQSLLELEVSWNVKFERVRFVCGDFLRGNLEILNRPVVFFGNPPFVTNKVGHSKWKNSFADFLELALETCGTDGAVHFIVPISIAFSRDYKKLRQMLVDRGGLVALSNFDNIPDTLFKSGKPLHKNTNKSNSQRCSLISVLPAKKPSVMSTQLHRWSKKGRKNLLETRPRYYDVSDFLTEGQFIRPKSSAFLNYYRNAVGQSVLGGMESPRGKHELNVASVARNFIGIRDVGDQASQSLSFESEHDFLRAFIIITSDVFMDYWLSIGDGFHLTRSNLVGFPVDDRLQNRIDKLIPQARRVWTVREHFAKEKLNSGAFTRSFDFSNVFPSLYEAA